MYNIIRFMIHVSNSLVFLYSPAKSPPHLLLDTNITLLLLKVSSYKRGIIS